MKKLSVFISINIYMGLLICLLLFSQCAKVVSPSGGDKDVEKPEIEKVFPENKNANFESDKIKISFNEFVKLNNITKNFLISPIIQTPPEFKIKGKSLIIDFDEEFENNTTYTIYLGGMVADITESNELAYYKYVFSTGNIIDSLMIEGKLLNAFDREPAKDILVMLFDKTSDSIVYKEKPKYIAKTDSLGHFGLYNLAMGKYKIFALKDANANYIYDMPNEEIAFSDSLIIPENDNNEIINDSTISDSIKKIVLSEIKNYEMLMFQEIDSTQKILESSYTADLKLIKIFLKYPPIKLKINALKPVFDREWNIKESGKKGDTLLLWLKDVDTDSLIIQIVDDAKIVDTLKFGLIEKRSSRRKPGRKKKGQINLELRPLIKKGKNFDYFRKVKIECASPLVKYDMTKVILIENNDTLTPEVYFADSIINRTLVLKHTLKENSEYKLIIDSAAFIDMRGLSNDSLLMDFKTNSAKEFGTLFANLFFAQTDQNYIVQLFDEKNNLLGTFFLSENKKLIVNNLTSGNYKFKIIHDINKNGIWDTGNYLLKKQAEPVFISRSKIIIKKNWDTDIDWKVN